MSLFRVTTKRHVLSNGVRVEKGMSVEVVTNSIQTAEAKQKIADAFKQKYGIDINKTGVLSAMSINLDIQKVS